MPSLKNLQVDLFQVFPDQRIVFGQVAVGGNSIIFTPIPQLRSYEIAKQHQNQCAVQIMVENVEKVAISDSIPFVKVPTQVQVLRALGRQDFENQSSQEKVIIPSTKENPTQKVRILDVQLLNLFLNKNHLYKLCSEKQNRFLTIKLYRGDQFVFFGFEHQLKYILDEILEFVLKTPQKFIETTSGSEDFDFYQFEPPKDIEKIIDKVTQNLQNEAKIFQRHGVFYKKKLVQKKQKLTGLEQIQYLQQQQTKIEKRKIDSKKFISSTRQWEQKEFISYFKKFGNLVDDAKTQKMWQESKKLETQESKSSQEDSESESDLQIVTNEEVDQSIYQKLSKEMLKNAFDGQEQSQRVVDEALLQVFGYLIKKDLQLVLNPLKSENHFLGSVSNILSMEELLDLKAYLPQKYKCFKAFVQYQTQRDGKYLQNLWDSYSLKNSLNLISDVKNEIEEQKINKVENKVEKDSLINLKNLSFAQIQLLAVLMKTGEKIIVQFNESPTQKRFGSKETSLLTKIGTQFIQYKTTAKNQIYLVKETDRLIVGSNGSALVLFKDLLTATTAACDTFDSPSLFQGQVYDKFTQNDVQEVEIIRFVVGE